MTKFLITSDLHYGFNNENCEIIMDFIESLPNVDAVLIAGDIISHDQNQWEDILELLRIRYNKTPILMVMGNHDYWSTNKDFISDQRNRIKLFNKWNITNLEENNMYNCEMINDIPVFGFAGWYGNHEPPSNDKLFIPKYIGSCKTFDYISITSYKNFERCLLGLSKLDTKYIKSVVITHFEPNSHVMGASVEILDKIKKYKRKEMVFCCGHSHIYRQEEQDGFRLYNPGGDYNIPKYCVFDVE